MTTFRDLAIGTKFSFGCEQEWYVKVTSDHCQNQYGEMDEPLDYGQTVVVRGGLYTYGVEDNITPSKPKENSMAMSFQALRLLNVLRQQADGVTETHIDGSVWREVLPMDVHVKGITAQQKPGYLSALEKAGFYRKTDKYFGLVKLPGKSVSE